MARTKTTSHEEPPAGVFRCVEGFVAVTETGPVVVHGGALIPYDYPYLVMVGRETLFDDVSQPRPAAAEFRGVEQATAAPGEKRAVAPPDDPTEG